jgi:hypothetical protein
MKQALLGTLLVCATWGLAQAAGWQTYSSESGIEVRYPDTLLPAQTKGTSCIDNVCKPIEDFSLKAWAPGSHLAKNDFLKEGYNPKTGETRKAYVNFGIQRGINKDHQPLKDWYQSMKRKPLDPILEKEITVGGRPAIRRRGASTVYSAKGPVGETVTVGGGHGVKGQKPVDTVYVQINDSDLLTISNTYPQTDFDATFEKILSSVQFKR